MNIAPNLAKVIDGEQRFEVKWFHATTAAVLAVVAIAYIAIAIHTDNRVTESRTDYTLCEEDSRTDCADYRGEGITINGERLFSCNTVEAPCFTYRVEGYDTLIYSIVR